MHLHCLGLNHRTTPIEIREKFWFSSDEIRAILGILKEHNVKESVLVSTCNRTELYYIAEDDSIPSYAIRQLLAGYKESEVEIHDKYFYSISSLHAVNHLFKLSSGADSMVLGDIQILNQIKTAYALAQEAHATGLILNRLFNNAIHTGKRARTETEVSHGAVSVGYAAAELASKIFQDLSGKTALLIGAGDTGALTAKHLAGQGLGKLIITNRTRERALELLTELNGTVVDFEDLFNVLPDVDIVISSISTNRYILSMAQIREAVKFRRNRPLFLIDLGMPRNIDPLSGTLDNVFLHDIDDLFHIVDKNLDNRKREIPKINEIVFEQLKEFDQWHNSLQINPTIQQLRDQFEQIRQAEVEKYLHRFSPESQEEVALITKRIINKILHVPTVNLRKETSGKKADSAMKTISILRSLFDLNARVPR